MENSSLDLKEINSYLENASGKGILEYCFDKVSFSHNLAIVTSCSLPVTIDLLYRELNLRVPVIFIDTLHHFPETLETARNLEKHYGFTIVIYQPREVNNRRSFTNKYGDQLWKKDINRYHYLTKIEPLERALDELNITAWITGRRRDQSIARRNLPLIEQDPKGRIKINPLAKWTGKDVWHYLLKHDVPYNPLHDQGYGSIGDQPLTTPIYKGESERNGRWRGMNKTECGIHYYSSSSINNQEKQFWT